MYVRRRGQHLLLAIAATLASQLAAAETPRPNHTVSLRHTLELALDKYPSITVSKEQRNAAAAAIGLARQVYLPRIDGTVQITRETSNNARQWLFPAGAPNLENIGVRQKESLASGFTTAAGVLISWEPFDFGSRRAKVEAAQSSEERARYAVESTKLEVTASAADAYLTVLAAEGTAVAAKAAVDRAEVFLKVVQAQVQANIRPGADGSRAAAELASAKIQLSKAEQATDIARAILAQYTLGTGDGVEPLKLPALPPKPPMVISDISQHPVMQQQNATLAEAQARLRVAKHSADPKFSLEGGVFGYDSAFEADGHRRSAGDGIGLETENYGAGLTMNVPFGELLVLRDRKAQEQARVNAEQNRADVLRLDLTKQLGVVDATISGARKVADQAPLLVRAAKDAYDQSLARYRAGLSQVVDVADAQRVLAQAEIDDALASLAVWQAWFSAAVLAPSAEDFLKGIPY